MDPKKKGSPKKEEPKKVAAVKDDDDDLGNDDSDGESSGAGIPPWIVTFADLSTLMLTFFVLMLSFANVDIVKFKEMLGSVQDAFGVQKKRRGEYQAVVTGNPDDKVLDKESSGSGSSVAASKQKIKMAKEINNVIRQTKQSKNISITIGAHGVMVRIKGEYLFDPGKALLRQESLNFLDSIAKIMEKFPFKLKVTGHTDNIPISTKEFPSNWELSAIRATRVLRYFTEIRDIAAYRLSAIGVADNQPIAPNDEVAGRAKNRRVEFIFSK